MHPSQQLSRIVDEYGKPMSRGPAKKPLGMNAYVDVSYITEENAEHWSWARSGDANTNLDMKKRIDSRRRARYETQNNNFLLGLTETVATDTIGPGPILEMQTEDKDRNRQIERDWKSWAAATDLHNKLWTMIKTKLVDGEVFGLLIFREAVDHFVKLDLQVLEADQCGNPLGVPDDAAIYDGIRQDNFGMPIEYHFYDRHPFSLHSFPFGGHLQGDWYAPNRVIHLFKAGRPGQLRGVTELAAALPIAAIWRRYLLATLLAAENVASISMAMKTNTSADIDFQPIDPLTTFNWPRNQLLTLPEGWDPFQVKAEQPVDTFAEFEKCIKLDMARSVGVPATIALLNSAEHNYSSARVDQIPYIRTIDTTRANQVELRGLERIFNLWIRFYADGGSVFDISSDDVRREFPHRWGWTPHQAIDEEKRANALETMWNMGHVSDDDVLFSMGKDPETHYEQLKIQNKRRIELGMPIPGVQPGMFEPQSQPGSQGQGASTSSPTAG